MLFSIILPVYNVEKYLRECVDSILSQTFTDYEIILVDDGSVDSSPKICDEYAEKDNRIKVIHKKNGGLSDARNAGTEIANGEYIIYIDSDDFLIDNSFLSKVCEKTRSGVDLVFYKYVKFFDGTKQFSECNFGYQTALTKEGYAEKISALVKSDSFYGMAWIKAIKTSVIKNNNIMFEVGLLGEDMEWNYHIITHSSNIDFVDEPFIAYRQREGSITSTHKLKNLTDFIYILEKWSQKIEDDIQDPNLKNALLGSLAKYYSNMLIVYARLRDKEKKAYKHRIEKLGWLLKHSLSKRPKTVAKIYGVFGFGLTIFALNILDRIK